MFIKRGIEKIGLNELRVCRFGGGGDSVDYSTKETEDEEKDVKKMRSALFKTEGGSGGQEIMTGGVQKRETIFGN